jgi:transposase
VGTRRTRGPAEGFEGLYGLVSHGLGRDPLSGDLFLFVNRSRTRAKVLFWDGTGLCIYQKRLEQGRFACLWKSAAGEPVDLTVTELGLFLEGSQLVERVRLSPERFTPTAFMISREFGKTCTDRWPAVI